MNVDLRLGDNMESLKKLPDNSIDSVVTDPPYGINFMGKKWDYQVPTKEFWEEVMRVLKPGGHILSFCGTRTYHRMVVNIEDAGFEIRDCISWLYGSGFPKSHNIGKAIQKATGEVKVIGTKKGAGTPGKSEVDVIEINNEYEGWGSALKTAQEIICVARKPLSEPTIAANVLKWGTGGINIDGCRIGNEVITTQGGDKFKGDIFGKYKTCKESNHEGRFPANIIFDEYAASLLDAQSGSSKSVKRNASVNKKGYNGDLYTPPNTDYRDDNTYSDSGGASRFFYVAKVSKKERNMGLEGFEDKIIEGRDANQDKLNNTFKGRPTPTKNTHPTVKPIKLLTYLCRLVTPKGGIVLDPFMGSGSTGVAAQLEGFSFIGMEMEQEYFNIAKARIEAYEKYRNLLK